MAEVTNQGADSTAIQRLPGYRHGQGDNGVPFQQTPSSTATLTNHLLASSTHLLTFAIQGDKKNNTSLAIIYTVPDFSRVYFYCKSVRICHLYWLSN